MWSKLAVSAVDFTLNLVITLICTSGLLWVAGASEAPVPTVTPDALKAQIGAQVARNDDLRQKIRESQSEADRLKTELEQLSRKSAPDLQSQSGSLADLLDQAQAQQANVEDELRRFLPELQRLRKEQLKSEQAQKEYAEIRQKLIQQHQQMIALRAEIARIVATTVAGPAVQITLPPRFKTEQNREPVYIMLIQGTVTLMRPPYYVESRQGPNRIETFVKRGTAVDLALTSNSEFMRLLDQIDAGKQYIYFGVDASSFETLRAVRNYLNSRQIASGWDPMLGSNIVFGSKGEQPGTQYGSR